MQNAICKKSLSGRLLVVLIFVCICFSMVACGSNGVEITNEMVVAKIEAAGELTTAKLTYNGLLYYEEGKIPLLTKKAFFVVYQAKVDVGIDMSQIDVDVTNSTVRITAPEPGIQLVYVDPASIKFYDDKAALFNKDDKNDAVDAIAAAEADVRENADIAQLVDLAKSQTVLLLENLFEGSIGERELVVKFK